MKCFVFETNKQGKKKFFQQFQHAQGFFNIYKNNGANYTICVWHGFENMIVNMMLDFLRTNDYNNNPKCYFIEK